MGMQLLASRNQILDTVPVGSPLAHAIMPRRLTANCERATVTMQRAQAYAALFLSQSDLS